METTRKRDKAPLSNNQDKQYKKDLLDILLNIENTLLSGGTITPNSVLRSAIQTALGMPINFDVVRVKMSVKDKPNLSGWYKVISPQCICGYYDSFEDVWYPMDVQFWYK